MRALALAWLALASGCSLAEPPPGPSGRPVVSLSEMAGAWSIVRFENYEPVRLGLGGQPQAYVLVRDGGLGFMLGCNSSGAEARLSRDATLSASGDGIQTLIGCGREREARDGRFFGFFRSKPEVRWAEGGRIVLTDARTTLLLERPETRRLAFGPTSAQLAGRWVPQMAYPRPGLGYGFQGQDAAVEITTETIRYSGCPRLVGRFRYLRDYRLAGTRVTDWTRCALDGGSGYNDERARGLLRVLASDPVAELTEGGGLTLSAGAEVVSLRREADVAREQERLRRAPPPLDAVNPPPPTPPAPRP